MTPPTVSLSRSPDLPASPPAVRAVPAAGAPHRAPLPFQAWRQAPREGWKPAPLHWPFLLCRASVWRECHGGSSADPDHPDPARPAAKVYLTPLGAWASEPHIRPARRAWAIDAAQAMGPPLLSQANRL